LKTTRVRRRRSPLGRALTPRHDHEGESDPSLSGSVLQDADIGTVDVLEDHEGLVVSR